MHLHKLYFSKVFKIHTLVFLLNFLTIKDLSILFYSMKYVDIIYQSYKLNSDMYKIL